MEEFHQFQEGLENISDSTIGLIAMILVLSFFCKIQRIVTGQIGPDRTRLGLVLEGLGHFCIAVSILWYMIFNQNIPITVKKIWFSANWLVFALLPSLWLLSLLPWGSIFRKGFSFSQDLAGPRAKLIFVACTALFLAWPGTFLYAFHIVYPAVFHPGFA